MSEPIYIPEAALANWEALAITRTAHELGLEGTIARALVTLIDAYRHAAKNHGEMTQRLAERDAWIREVVMVASVFQPGGALYGVLPWGASSSADGLKWLIAEHGRLTNAAHRCSGCGHRWDGPLNGAELCGNCWRKAQDVVLERT